MYIKLWCLISVAHMHMSRRLSNVVAITSLRKLTLLPAAVDYLQPFNSKWGLVNHASTHTGILAIGPGRTCVATTACPDTLFQAGVPVL